MLGSIIIFNIYKKLKSSDRKNDYENIESLSKYTQNIYHDFLNCKDFFKFEDFYLVEKDIKKLTERLQFCAAFEQTNLEIDEDIKNNIVSLRVTVTEILLNSQETLDDILKKILDDMLKEAKNLTNITLLLIDRREKLLIK